MTNNYVLFINHVDYILLSCCFLFLYDKNYVSTYVATLGYCLLHCDMQYITRDLNFNV